MVPELAGTGSVVGANVGMKVACSTTVAPAQISKDDGGIAERSNIPAALVVVYWNAIVVPVPPPAVVAGGCPTGPCCRGVVVVAVVVGDVVVAVFAVVVGSVVVGSVVVGEVVGEVAGEVVVTVDLRKGEEVDQEIDSTNHTQYLRRRKTTTIQC